MMKDNHNSAWSNANTKEIFRKLFGINKQFAGGGGRGKGLHWRRCALVISSRSHIEEGFGKNRR